MFFPAVTRNLPELSHHQNEPSENIQVIYNDEHNVPIEEQPRLKSMSLTNETSHILTKTRLNDKDSLMARTRLSNESKYSQRQSFISNPILLDSMSSLDLNTQRTIIRLITVFSVLFFVICFGMIAFTLRYSSYVDAKIRESYTGDEKAINFNGTFNVVDIRIKPSSQIELELIRQRYKEIHDLNTSQKNIKNT